MEISNLVIETTRRCNATCEHCLRGDAENLEMSPAYLDELFSRLSYVSSITFTGGEPSLAPQVIEETLQIAEKHGVEIGSFYIATNALHVSDAFLLAVMRLYCYCSDNEMSALHWSNDAFHPNFDTNKLEVFRFAAPKLESSYRQPYFFNEGRAIENGIGECAVRPEVFEIEDEHITEGVIYLNCEGNIVAGCDWSYESQREEKKIISHVSEFSLEKLQAFNDKSIFDAMWRNS